MQPPFVPVTDDIIQVHLPLPFALNRVNVYLLRGADGWTVVDTGLNTPQARETWDAVFAGLDIRPADISQIVLTHAHPDHYGLAGWFQQRAGEHLPVRLSAREADFARETWQQGRMGDAFDRHLMRLGMPANLAADVAAGFVTTAAMTRPHPARLELLPPGGELRLGRRRFNILPAPGHSDGQLIFYDPDDRLLLCGDHVLLKITPNVGLWPTSDPDPLGRFMDSLRGLAALDVRLALPGHKALITDWAGRVRELLAHHQARLEHTLAAVAGGATVYEAALKVFDSGIFSTHEWRFAMAETLAHLDTLERQGRVRREDDGAHDADDAARRYRPTG